MKNTHTHIYMQKFTNHTEKKLLFTRIKVLLLFHNLLGKQIENLLDVSLLDDLLGKQIEELLLQMVCYFNKPLPNLGESVC